MPAKRPKEVAVNKPFPAKYPHEDGPEIPRAAPPPANRFGNNFPLFFLT